MVGYEPAIKAPESHMIAIILAYCTDQQENRRGR
jgi:hypothetical protein